MLLAPAVYGIHPNTLEYLSIMAKKLQEVFLSAKNTNNYYEKKICRIKTDGTVSLLSVQQPLT